MAIGTVERVDVPVQVELAERPGVLARVGLVALATDEIGPSALRCVLPEPEVELFTTLADYDESPDGTSCEFLGGGLTHVAGRCLPPQGRIDLLALGCTSATMIMGRERLLAMMTAARPGVPCTSPGIAAHEALAYLGVYRLGVLTPYARGTHERAIAFLEEGGVRVVAAATFELHSDAEIASITRASLLDALERLRAAAPMDALFVSCAAVNVVQHIAGFEVELGLPVLSSSQALGWHCLRLLDLPTARPGFGRLLAA